MAIDNRIYTLLLELINNRYITSNLLEKKLNLTKRQLSYAIQKLNEYLETKGLTKIERTKNGTFIIAQSVVNFCGKNVATDTSENRYILSEQERITLFILYLIMRDGKISLVHLSSLLKVSQNTILNDIKKSKGLLTTYNIQIEYERKQGYFILGNEIDKRYILLELIKKVSVMPNGIKIISNLLKIDTAILHNCQKIFNKIEVQQKIKITDQQLNILIYFTYATLIRIKNNKKITSLPNNYIEKNDKLLAIIQQYLTELGIADLYEQCFFSLLLKSANIYELIDKDYNIDSKLFDSSVAVVNNFEQIACIIFKDKQELIYRIYQHWKPAFYRISYNIKTMNSVYDIVEIEFRHLHELVKRSIAPFESIVNQDIPDEEIAFFTVLFGGWLTKEGLLKKIKTKKIGVVVCGNSVTISNYLFFKLQTLLPELHFDATMSVREYENYHKYHDAVFSTTAINTDKSLFIIDPAFKLENKIGFRNQVIADLQGFSQNNINIDDLIKIIEQHCNVNDKKSLKRALSHYIYQEGITEQLETLKLSSTSEDTPSLSALLSKQNIIIHHTTNINWEKCIYMAAKPLLDSKIISQNYIENIIYKIKYEKPYIMLSDKIIIAHAGIEEGVYDVGMSVLKLPSEININNYLYADIIIVLATNNLQRHLKALSQLNDFLEFDDGAYKLRNSQNYHSVIDYIKSYK